MKAGWLTLWGKAGGMSTPLHHALLEGFVYGLVLGVLVSAFVLLVTK